VNTSPEVDAWFADYEHPAKDAMERVGELLLGADRMVARFMKVADLAEVDEAADELNAVVAAWCDSRA
jgi:hypothetical protein